MYIITVHFVYCLTDSSAKFVIDVAIGLEGNKHRDGDRLHSDKEHKKNIHIHYRYPNFQNSAI